MTHDMKRNIQTNNCRSLRSLILMAVMMTVGVTGAWGQTDYSGTYYLANNNSDNFLGYSNANNYYLCAGEVYYNNGAVVTTDNQKPLMTTYQTKQTDESLWIVEKVTASDYTDYYTFKQKFGNSYRYLTVHNKLTSYSANRMRVHLEEIAPNALTDRNYFSITLITTNNGISGYSIGCLDKYKDNNNQYLNPADGNKPQKTPTSAKNNTGGMVGFYTIGTTDTDAKGSVWFFEVPMPTIRFNSENKIEITYVDNTATIYYTTNGDVPPTSGTEHIYGGPFDPDNDVTTIKAYAVANGKVSTLATYEPPFLLGSTHKYIIQSKQCQSYRLIPNTSINETTKYVSTLNVPCETMAWYFEYAEDGYYYVVDNSGWYLYYTTTDITNKYVYLKSSKDDSDGYKFSITAHASGGFNLIPKGQTTPINKNNYGTGNAGLTPARLSGSVGDATSRWDLIPYSAANLPQWADAPFTNVSDNNHTYYYQIVSVSQPTKPIILNNDEDVKSQEPPTGIDERKTMWIIKDAGTSGLLHFYSFENAYTGEKLYYKGNGRKATTATLQLGMPSVEGASEQWSHFVIVQTGTGYNMIPRPIVDDTKAINTSGNHEAFNCINRYNGGDVLGTYYDDGNGSRWTFSQVAFCMPPVFEESGGNITISCATNGAEIHYQTTDDSDPTGSSTLYNNGSWPSSTQVRVKAIAVVKDGETVTASSAVVTLLNKPDITLEAGPYIYKGEAWEPSLTVSIGETGSETTASSDTYTATYANNVNAGTATVTLSDADPTDTWYIWNGSTTFPITPKAITITAASETRGYNGTPLTNNSYTCDPSLATGDSFTSVTVTGSQTNVGSSDNVPSAAVIKNGSNEVVTGNYNITYANGTLTVTEKRIDDGTGSSPASDIIVSVGEGNTIILTQDGTPLTLGTDYTVGTPSPSTSGKYSTRTVSGSGNYIGSFTVWNAIAHFQNDGNGGTDYSATFVAEGADLANPNSALGHALPSGITAYIITSISGNVANAESLGYIPEGVPVLLLSNEACEGFFVQDASGQTAITSDQINNNMLEEVKASMNGFVDDNTSQNDQKAHFNVKTIYLLYNNEFVYNMDGYLAKGKVFLNPSHPTDPSAAEATPSPSPSRLQIRWNTETGIAPSQLSSLTSHPSGTWYTLDGRRLSGKPVKKGLYLCNGEKIVVK